MAKHWEKVAANEEDYLAGALFLLQLSVEGYHRLSVAVLQGKMKKPTMNASDLIGLHVFSYADTTKTDKENLKWPLVSAFFFLRQCHRPGKKELSEATAYCLTVGALPYEADGSGGLEESELKDELVVICKTMRPRYTSAGNDEALLEVMHGGTSPKFKDRDGNLERAYKQLAKASTPPMLEPKGTIDVVRPWTAVDYPELLNWCNIKEKA